MRWRWHRARALMGAGIAGAALIVVFVSSPALAAWGTGPVNTVQTLSAATLAAPTGAVAVNGTCVARTSWHVNVSWTATTSTVADGYEILRSTTTGGPYTPVGTVAGRTTTTFTDTSPAANTTYFYVVQATRNLWRSANSNQATVTTLKQNCN